MSARKSHEQLAMTRTKRRAAKVRKLIEEIGYDWFDSEVHVISAEADRLIEALDEFDKDAAEAFAEYCEREAEL